jgi:hypothetical protein
MLTAFDERPFHAATSKQGAIAGVVRDATGAVLPGVSVEAASPALIEKVRTVVTNGEGQYKILDLRPGTYTVTFSLTGFNVLKREGVELTTGIHGDRECRNASGIAPGNGHGLRRDPGG